MSPLRGSFACNFFSFKGLHPLLLIPPLRGSATVMFAMIFFSRLQTSNFPLSENKLFSYIYSNFLSKWF